MYRIVETIRREDGMSLHVLKACSGYYGWGYESVEIADAYGALSCVQFDTREEAIAAGWRRVDEALTPA